MMKAIKFCTILLVLLTAAVITSGCIGADYVPNHDIVLVRLSPDGTTEWTQTIDAGFDDTASDVIETSDRGFVLAAKSADARYGPYESRLVRISPDGDILPDLESDDTYNDITALLQTPDGGFAAVTGNGNIIRLGPDGSLLWRTETGITDVSAIIETADGGFAIAGVRQDTIPFGSVPVYDENGNVSYREPLPDENVATPGCHEKTIHAGDREITVTECTVPFDIIRQAAVVKVDSDGGIAWKRSYGETGVNSAGSIAGAPDCMGFLVAGYETIRHDELNYTNYIAAILLDDNGKVLHAERIGQTESFASPLIHESPVGYDILFVNTTLVDGFYCSNRAVAHFDTQERHITSVNPLDIGVALAVTDDGGYFTAGFPRSGGCAGYRDAVYSRSDEYRLHAALTGPDMKRIWEREIDGTNADSVKKVIQTRDGGFLILAMKENY